MRVTMIAVGSTGDVRPYVILGSELKRRGADVTITCFRDFEKMVLGAGLKFYPLPGDAVTLMSGVMTASTGIAFLQQFKNIVSSQLDELLAALMDSCRGADAVITTFIGSMIYSIAEKYGVPCIQTHFYPMDINGVTPITTVPDLHMGRSINKASYKLGYLLINTVEWKYLTDWRRTQGMRTRKITPYPDYEVNGHKIPVLYAISPLLLPRSVEWDEHIHMTGFLLPRGGATDFAPPPALSEFLAAGSTPVYIGFGSMCDGEVGRTLDIVLEAVRLAGVRAIIARGWGGANMRAARDRSDIYVADYLPHDWLFKRVAAVVHHGGAGTTAAGILAYRPTLVIPFGGDQHFWASRVHALGLGPRYIRRDSLTGEKLARALIELTTVKSYQVAARELGERLAMEDGVTNAANIIEREIALWDVPASKRTADGANI